MTTSRISAERARMLQALLISAWPSALNITRKSSKQSRSGEYLGWNAKNLTLINCTIESLQGMCYIDNLVMKNCKLINTTLAFEYSTVEAQIVGKIDSVMNPSGGTICADSIGELILEKDKVDPNKTRIICKANEKDCA